MLFRSSLILIIAVLSSCDFRYGKDRIEHPTFDGAAGKAVLLAINNELSQRPNDGELLKRKVRFLESSDWPIESSITLDKAVEILPDDGELLYLKARYHLERDELTPAIIALGKAGRVGYLTAEYFSVYAQVLLKAGETEEALKQANRFKQLDPGNYRSEIIRGKIFYELGDSTAAINAFNLAFDQQKEDDELNLLLLDLMLGRKDNAGFNRVISKIERDDKSWLLKLGMLKYNYGLIKEANTDFRKILDRDNRFIPAMLYLGTNYFKMTYYDSARHYARMAISIDSLSLSARLIQARSLDKQYQYSESIEQYQALLAIDSAYDNVDQELKEVYRKVAYLRRLKEEKEAIPQFDFGPVRKNTNINN